MKLNYKLMALWISWLIVMLPMVQAQLLQGPQTDTDAPEITSVLLTHGPQTLVTWTTDEPADSKVEYGETTDLAESSTKTDLETAHSLTLQTLEGQTYHYRVTSCDANGNCGSTSIENFVAGPFFVQADIPRYPRSIKIDIPGRTRPGATVTVIVNGAEVRKDLIDDGEFLFRNVQIGQANNITLKSELGTESAEQTYEANVDNAPAIINVSTEPVVTTSGLTVKIRVSEPVNLTIERAKPTFTT